MKNKAHNPNKKFSMQEVLNDSPDFLLQRVKDTIPNSQSMTLHSARAIAEALESMNSRLDRIARALEERKVGQ